MPDAISHWPWYYIPTVVGTQVAVGGDLNLLGGSQSETYERSLGSGTYVPAHVHPSRRQGVRAALSTGVAMRWVLVISQKSLIKYYEYSLIT